MKLRGILLASLAAGLALSSCSSTSKPGSAATKPTNPTTGRSATTPPTTVPSSASATFKGPRIIVVVEENHSADQILGSPRAPTINAISRTGTTLTKMFATRHPSLPNYIAIISGDTHGITSDCGKCHVAARNLVDQLESAGISWKAYLQGLPAPCSASVKTQGAYAKKHNPFEYFDDIASNPARCNKLVPLTQLSTDIADGTLPQFVWITPDLDHDMHGAGEGGNDSKLIANADSWLAGLYGQLTASSAWRQDTRLVVTWDEGAGGDHNGPHGCCGGDAVGGHIPTIVVGPQVPIAQDAQAYDHYALLRSIESAYGMPYLGHAADPVTKDIPALAK